MGPARGGALVSHIPVRPFPSSPTRRFSLSSRTIPSELITFVAAFHPRPSLTPHLSSLRDADPLPRRYPPRHPARHVVRCQAFIVEYSPRTRTEIRRLPVHHDAVQEQ
jgi:hypothetical protein